MDDCQCLHTYCVTRVVIEHFELDPDEILPWLQKYGGFCDCSVIFHVIDSCRALD